MSAVVDKLKALVHPNSTEISGKKVGPTGFGLMNFTWRPTNTPDDIAFAAMNNSLSHGGNLFVSGEFYGTQNPQDNLYLLNRYYTKYPEAADKIVLSVKGGVDLARFKNDGSPEGIRKSIDNILEKLDGKAKLDIFCTARVDTSVELETTYKTIKEEYIDTGKIGGFCLSEASAATIRRAAKVIPVACVEVEVSLWATEIFENGVADACRELGIPIVAYSPLGRGFLTGALKSHEDIPEGDMRKRFDRFQPDTFSKNLELVTEVQKLAEKKGVTPAQLALAWVRQQGTDGLIIIPIPGATKPEQVEENLQEVTLTKEELAEIDAILKTFKPIGGRYAAFAEGTLYQ